MAELMPVVTLIGGPLDGEMWHLRPDQRRVRVPLLGDITSQDPEATLPVSEGEYRASGRPRDRGKLFWFPPSTRGGR